MRKEKFPLNPFGYIDRYLILKRPSDKWLARNKISIAENEIIKRKSELLLELDRLNKISERLVKAKQSIIKAR